MVEILELKQESETLSTAMVVCSCMWRMNLKSHHSVWEAQHTSALVKSLSEPMPCHILLEREPAAGDQILPE